MRSALRMVASRCAMTKVVRPFITSSSAFCSLASLRRVRAPRSPRRGSGSAGRFRSARAIERRWRWPPDSVTAALADLACHSPFQVEDEVIGKRILRRRLDIGLAGTRPAEADIVPRRRREDGDVLRHDGNALPDRNGDRPRARRRHRSGSCRSRDRRSAASAKRPCSCRPRRADNGHRLARHDLKIKPRTAARSGLAG
jgi:hypothetical protein